MHCQDVSSFGNAPVKMCSLWAGGLVCVCVCVYVCVFFIICALNALSRCVVFGQGALCVCACVLSLFCPNCIVKMCRVMAMHLSRCVVFGKGALCVCVHVFFLFSALNALSRCVVFRQCTYQDVSSLGRGPCVCVCMCVCSSFLFLP